MSYINSNNEPIEKIPPIPIGDYIPYDTNINTVNVTSGSISKRAYGNKNIANNGGTFTFYNCLFVDLLAQSVFLVSGNSILIFQNCTFYSVRNVNIYSDVSTYNANTPSVRFNNCISNRSYTNNVLTSTDKLGTVQNNGSVFNNGTINSNTFVSQVEGKGVYYGTYAWLPNSKLKLI